MKASGTLLMTVLVLTGVTACGSPPTKTVKTTTTTTTVDEHGNSSAQAHSELRSGVPATQMAPVMTPVVPGTSQTVEQTRSVEPDGTTTTTTTKRVTNY